MELNTLITFYYNLKMKLHTNYREIFHKDFHEGTQAEILFMKDLKLNLDIESRPATKEQNMYEHWDVIDENNVKYDVKKHKGLYNYIELTNQFGNKGWLYGQADVFAFRVYSMWVLVDKEVLQHWVEKNITNKTPIREKKLYRCYQKRNWKDSCAIVKSYDLVKIAYQTL